ncbi:ABC transporter substrate-binding protein [Megasphaera elsdenii]|uniref:ABC transporter substrate-binding protein n=1 Tax=Megasphaera elsdenii TaxID=907 RepID=UPI00195D4807|nr:ABC transporter substrate-binding protein [Megasphaera elsdenii]MBM6701379.1 ABC transporter substrate-binding protein [Megasphaera elsdenii]
MKRYMEILAFCMLFMAFFLSGCSLSPTNTGVLIGTNLALSGKGMSYSTSTERGIELAKDMVNDRDGLLGRPVQIVSVDNHGKPEDAEAAIQQLTVRHVSAIIGPDLTDCTRAVLPNVEAVKIPLISPACTQPDITVDPKSHEVYRYIFRAAYIDASQGRAMADYALKQLHVKRAAVFYYPDKTYAQGLAEYFRSAFAASGGEVPVYIPVEEVQDLTKYLSLLQRENVDVIYLPGYDDWTIPAITLLRSHGISQPLLGPDGWNGPKMERDVDTSYLTQVYYTDHYAGHDASEAARRFSQAYYEKYGEWPDSYAALGYDAFMMTAEAIERCQSAEAPDVARELEKTIDYDGATGTISLDANHDAIKDVFIMTFKDGQPELAATIPKDRQTQ